MSQLTSSAARIAANRLNAGKSTGPRTSAGKDRVRLNALKHGMTAQAAVLPGEDPDEFADRREGFMDHFQPRETLEYFLVERIAHESWRLDRACRAEVALTVKNAKLGPVSQANRDEGDAIALGARLFHDRRGPIEFYPTGPYAPDQPRTSLTPNPDNDPDNPALLVNQLESTGAGCHWLLERWAELRARLEPGQCWQSPDKLKAIRLLGKQPLCAADDQVVLEILLAASVLNDRRSGAYFDLSAELTDAEQDRFQKRLTGRQADSLKPADADAARALLAQIVDRATDRLSTLAAAHDEQAESAALDAGLLAFDATPEGERLRKHKNACERSFFGAITALDKSRKTSANPRTGSPADRPVLFPRLGMLDHYAPYEATVADYEDFDELADEPAADDFSDLQNKPIAADTLDCENKPIVADPGNLQNKPTAADPVDFEDEPSEDDGSGPADDDDSAASDADSAASDDDSAASDADYRMRLLDREIESILEDGKEIAKAGAALERAARNEIAARQAAPDARPKAAPPIHNFVHGGRTYRGSRRLRAAREAERR